MKIETIVDCDVLTRKDFMVMDHIGNGSSLKGYIRTDFKTLCRLFGPPTFGPFDDSGDKVTCEWKIVTRTMGVLDSLYLTIYDWKMEDTPLDKYYWHVGGKSPEVIDWLQGHGLDVSAFHVKL